MSNMSYCRFRNTVNDLWDCKDALLDEISDDDERLARKRLVKVCREIVEEWDDNEMEGDD